MALTFESPKDPDEVLDYQIDWTDRLDGDAIATSAWSLTTANGVAINSQTHTSSVSLVWLGGGTLNTTAELLCRITTTGGRTMDQTVKLKIKAK